MPIIACVLMWLSGWLLYRLLQRERVELSPASVALVWVLGAGVVYGIYYGFIAVLHLNPPPLIVISIGGLGALDIFVIRRTLSVQGWEIFSGDKKATLILCLLVLWMTISLFLSGFYADTTRMWMGKAEMLNTLPDYGRLLSSLTGPYHADYPMLFTHQFQWQLVWSDSMFSLKLPSWIWYVSILLAASHLLTRWTNHPVRWLIILAGFPQYWWVVPIGTADIPFSALWLSGIVWLTRYLEGEHNRLSLVALTFGLLVVTKNEGILSLICMLAGLIIIWIQQPSQRQYVMRAICVITIVAFFIFASWYIFIVRQVGVTIGEDFGLIGFDLERIPQIVEMLLSILFNPLLTAFLWAVLFILFARGHRQYPILWIPILLYLSLVSASYLFSVRDPIHKHILQSYFRLLLQIMPMGVIYVATCFSGKQLVPDP